MSDEPDMANEKSAGGAAPAAPLTDHATDWRTVALCVGEQLATAGPERYYDFTPDEWLQWALRRLAAHVTQQATLQAVVERMRVVIEAVRAVGSQSHWDASHWTLHVPKREADALFDLAYELDPDLARILGQGETT